MSHGVEITVGGEGICGAVSAETSGKEGTHNRTWDCTQSRVEADVIFFSIIDFTEQLINIIFCRSIVLRIILMVSSHPYGVDRALPR